MPLRKQKLGVIFSQGVQTKVDHKILPSESLTILENGEFSKVGRIDKRNGFTKVSKAVSGLISHGDDLISRGIVTDTDDDGTQASVYSEGMSDFVGFKGWSSGLDFTSLSVSRGSSLYQREAQASISDDGKYALVTFVSFDVLRDSDDQDEVKANITKRASLVDRESGTVLASDLLVGTASSTDGSCRMRSVWANNRFYIIGEDEGDLKLWYVDPSDSPAVVKGPSGSSAAGVLHQNFASGGDYPLTNSTDFPYLGLSTGFDICVSNNATKIHMIRGTRVVADRYVQYSYIEVDDSLSGGFAVTDRCKIPTGASCPRNMAIHRTQLGLPGGVDIELYVAYNKASHTYVKMFEEYEGTDADVQDIGDISFDSDYFMFVDNPEPTPGALPGGVVGDVDLYCSERSLGNTKVFENVTYNAGSITPRDISGSSVPIFAMSHRANDDESKGPTTLGYYHHRHGTLSAAVGDTLSPFGLATTDLAGTAWVDGSAYTNRKFPRERDYLTTNSFEQDYQQDGASKVAEPGWRIATGTPKVDIPGRVVALPMATNYNNHFGTITPNSVVQLYDFREKAFKSKCKASSATLKGITYVADNSLYSYDGEKFYPHGILDRPWVWASNYSGSGAGGSLSVTATYYYKAVFEWEDAKGNLHQSASSVSSSAIPTSGAASLVFPTSAFASDYTAAEPYDQNPEVYRDLRLSVYRTKGDGTIFNLNSSLNSFRRAASGYSSAYKTYKDRQDNSVNSTGRFLYTDSGELDSTKPPSSPRYVTAHKNRLFVVGKDNNVYFSKLAVKGFGLGFSEGFKLTIPGSMAGRPSALGSMDGILYVFTEDSIYYLLGEGPDNLGGGDFYEPKRLPSPVGAFLGSPVVLIDDGLLFANDEGIFLLSRKQEVSQIGAAVEDILGSNKVLDMKVNHAKQVVYFQTSSSSPEIITYNYSLKQWGRDVIQGESSAIESIEINQDRLVVSTGSDLYFADSSYSDDSSYIPLKLKTAWIKLETLQGYQRAYNFQILGESLEPHKLVVNVRYDYETGTPTDTYEFTSADAGKLQFKGHLSRQKCQAVQFEIYDEDASSTHMSGYTISQIELEFGYKADQYKNGMMKISASNTVGSNS